MDLGHFVGWNWHDVFEAGLVFALAGTTRHIVRLHAMINRLRREVRETARFTDVLTRANRDLEEQQHKEPWVGG